MKTFVDSDTSEVRIDIIPLVDVVFCVLIFFMLAAFGLTRFQEGIGLNLPRTDTPTGVQFGAKLKIQINTVGQVFINNTVVPEQEFVERLTDYRRQNPGALVVIDADRQVRYERVIEVLNLLTELGLTRVSMGTETGDSESQAPNNTTPLNPGLRPPPNPSTPAPGFPVPSGPITPQPAPPTNVFPTPNPTPETSANP